LQEQEHHQEHQYDGFNQGFNNALDRCGDHWSGVIRVNDFHALRKERFQVFDGLVQCFCGVQSVGTRCQLDRQARRRLAVELCADAVVLTTQPNLGHIAQANLGAVGVDLEQDLFELLGGLQAGFTDDGCVQLLTFDGRQAAQLSGGHLYVLRADGGFNVHRGQVVFVQLGRVEPDTHGVLGTEHLEVAHTFGTGNRVLHVGDDVVRQVVLVHAAVFGHHADDHQEVFNRLGHTDTLLLNLLRQQWGRQVELVLYLNLSGVRVCTLLEGGGDAHAAVGVAFRRHISQVVNTVELLLDHLNHGVLHGLRRSARVGHGDRDGRWRNARVLVDRQFEDR